MCTVQVLLVLAGLGPMCFSSYRWSFLKSWHFRKDPLDQRLGFSGLMVVMPTSASSWDLQKLCRIWLFVQASGVQEAKANKGSNK
jgi:hypothetical protein